MKTSFVLPLWLCLTAGILSSAACANPPAPTIQPPEVKVPEKPKPAPATPASQFIVISLAAAPITECKIIPSDNLYAAIYKRSFGPDTRQGCEKWVQQNCVAQPKPDSRPTLSEKTRVWEVSEAKLERDPANPSRLILTASGHANTLGWKNIILQPARIPPANGVYSYEFLGIKPSGPVGQALEAIKATNIIANPPPDLKAIRVLAKTNSKDAFPK